MLKPFRSINCAPSSRRPSAGSFSAAGRQLRRAQSVVSHTPANLEAQAGVKLFDRTGRYPVLIDAGRALLQEARAVLQGMQTPSRPRPSPWPTDWNRS